MATRTQSRTSNRSSSKRSRGESDNRSSSGSKARALAHTHPTHHGHSKGAVERVSRRCAIHRIYLESLCIAPCSGQRCNQRAFGTLLKDDVAHAVSEETRKHLVCLRAECQHGQKLFLEPLSQFHSGSGSTVGSNLLNNRQQNVAFGAFWWRRLIFVLRFHDRKIVVVAHF